jgi:hypothetical protein
MLAWFYLLISMFSSDGNNSTEREVLKELKEEVRKPPPSNILVDNQQASVAASIEARSLSEDNLPMPRRYHLEEVIDTAPSLDEIKKNLTFYLHTLHSRLGSLAGPTVDAEIVWENYLDVTKNTVMRWDDQNKHRFPKQRTDNSIFVSLGTYRDPYCPMTLKSLYAQAKNPERLYVGLLQQNCFEKKCRTGVLVGGRVEDMSTDVDCYEEFCKSPEGQRSNACNTGQVRLFNVNESESLGPYMARYLGAKFYR